MLIDFDGHPATLNVFLGIIPLIWVTSQLLCAVISLVNDPYDAKRYHIHIHILSKMFQAYIPQKSRAGTTVRVCV